MDDGSYSICVVISLFFFKQKTAYEMRISDWSSDVCSSDLLHLTEHTTMVLGILLSITAIGVFCWLLFTLAIYALPFFAGVTVGMWAYGTGAGWPGSIVVGLLAAGLMLGVGQFLFAFVDRKSTRLNSSH